MATSMLPVVLYHAISDASSILLNENDVPEFIEDKEPYKFDLYRVPFNEGRGGTATPIEGASQNGMSNFFAKFSPDGKWIVFTQAENYMLLMPDSELYIIPAEGGEARRLRANTPLMNSWHSFSSNGRWLVFSSKANTPYTQLFLTHIDAEGESTPPTRLNWTELPVAERAPPVRTSARLSVSPGAHPALLAIAYALATKGMGLMAFSRRAASSHRASSCFCTTTMRMLVSGAGRACRSEPTS